MAISNLLIWKKWNNILVEILDNLWENCIENESYLSGDCAEIERVENVEEKLGYKLPDSFRETILNFSSKLHIFWEIEGDNPLILIPEEYIGLSCDFGWDIDLLLELNNGVNKEFNNNKMIFHRFANGGILAFDLSNKDSPVIYSEETNKEGIEKTLLLGTNFIDFMNRWIVLGCLGTNFSQISKFVSSSGIDFDCVYAKKWREWVVG